MSLTTDDLFSGLPATLRAELIEEYNGIVSHFYEGRWRPAELHAGRFCEVVYSIIAGRAAKAYPSHSTKPDNFVQACRQLESAKGLERGLRILASRILPALYEVRNNRDVGHVGGDVDSNFMDASFAVASASWLMAELVRVFHAINTQDAKIAVDNLTQLKTPAVWISNNIKRVLNPSVKLADQILLLAASSGSSVTNQDLANWTETTNKAYLKKVIAALHKARLIEAASPEQSITLLPNGAARVRNLLAS